MHDTRGVEWLLLSLALGVCGTARAQAEDPIELPAPPASATSDTAIPAEIEGASDTATSDTATSEAAVAAPPPPGAVRRTAPPSPQAYDAERPLPPPPEPGFEIAIAMNASVVVAAGLSPSIATTTDLAVALDPRVWIGIGLALSYVEQRTMAFPGSPEMRFVTTTLGIPVFFQYYFAHPELNAAVPTFRLRVTGTWSETPNPPSPSTQQAGADLGIYGGVTWIGAPWLALRILGGLTAGFRATSVGAISITANAGVEALIAAVVRL